ncbi:MAG: OmpA family protein [Gemmatimonadetes bacterium]|nr:OmpA family protein [Gemmatimonadota bacterium]
MRHSASSPSRAALGLVLAVGVLVTSACSGLSNTQRGAAGGATTGAVLGAVIADATGGSTAVGAILGAAVGGAAGAAIGRRMDRQAEELEDELPGAEVERVGEGIQVTFDSGILFDFDSDALRSEARANLADLGASLTEYEGTRVLVVGHTDSRGTDEYNQALSERRANAARTYLLTQGISPERVEATGLGESEPVDSNETDAGRQANRRVEVAIFASEEMQEEMRSTHGGGR